MKYALKGMQILDGHENMTPVSGKAILVSEEKIVDIVPETEIPAEYKVEDMSGKYLLPGLINLHVHLPSSGRPTKKKMDYAKLARLLKFRLVRAVIRSMCAGLAKTELMSGTTTIRAVGGVLDFDTAIRDKINAGKLCGPRILASDYAVSVEGGHMTGSVALPAHSEEEARQMVHDIAKHNPDLIKLMITGGVLDADTPGEPGKLRMPESYVKAATEEAHKLGLKVAAHVESAEGMAVAIRSGVDTLEHGGEPKPEVIEALKNSDSVLVGTLLPAVSFALIDPKITGCTEVDVLNGQTLFKRMCDCVRICHEQGIPVGLGTDTGCPYTTHYDTWRELFLFCKYAGYTPTEALHTATEVNAKIAGLEDITGTVEPGKCADFILVSENPLEDITALRNPTDVVFRGEIIRAPKVKKMADVEKLLDEALGIA